MRIVVTAREPSEDAEVDPRFGRAAWFAVFDTDTDTFEFKDNNQNVAAAHGAGIQAGSAVADLGAAVVLTGDCGPKAARTLEAAEIEIVTGVTGTVGDACRQYLADRVKS